MKHFIAWHPDETNAYRCETRAEAEGLVTSLARHGGKGDWNHCRANGWRITVVDEPDPAARPVVFPRRPTAR